MHCTHCGTPVASEATASVPSPQPAQPPPIPPQAAAAPLPPPPQPTAPPPPVAPSPYAAAAADFTSSVKSGVAALSGAKSADDVVLIAKSNKPLMAVGA